MVQLVKQAFSHPERICEVNRTLIVLIPKKGHLETFKDLKPINLCNVIYKLITKVVANRMKCFMSHVIYSNSTILCYDVLVQITLLWPKR